MSIYLSWLAFVAKTQLLSLGTSLLSIIVLPSAIPDSATRTWHLSDSVMTLLSMATQTASESCTGVLSSSFPQKALSNSVLCSIILAVNFPENVPSYLSFFASSSVSEAEWVASRLTKVTGTPELRAI